MAKQWQKGNIDKMNRYEEALGYISPRDLDYTEWVNIGMALKHEGLDVSVWDSWSRDDERYREGECERKWQGFNEATGRIVTGGTIIELAKRYGYTTYGGADGNEILPWDGLKTDGKVTDPLKVVDTSWIEDAEIHEPQWPHKNSAKEIITYFETLFEQDDIVGYVTESKKWEKDGVVHYSPTKGQFTMTAGWLIGQLEKCNDDIGKVLGDYTKEAGAWVRFNPLDGHGVSNINVAKYKYALVESDSVSIGKQVAIVKELRLPVAVMVYSGNKSVHAIVRIDAANSQEYRKRVEYLYNVCEKNGLKPDTQNKNPSRLSRLPGVTRGDHKQFIIATNIGEDNFAKWQEYIESVNDDLPDPVELSDVWDHMPELSPELIEGILRKGHKLLMSGPSKAGKSFLLIELAIAIAEGTKWLDYQCAQGRVLYVNLEVDQASCFNRFKKEYEALEIEPHHLKDIDIWNLRGRSTPLDKLAPKLIRRAKKQRYTAVIIDPIYKVITGDENSASDMAAFCNQFDKIATELSCAVIYCHHHSKGAQGNKKSSDRASGSGVFARDPDAMLDMIELNIDDNVRSQALGALHLKTEQKQQITAWRIETTLREFPNQEPLNCFFSYPKHEVDEWSILDNCYADGDIREAQKIGARKRADKAEAKFIDAVNNANFGEAPTSAQLGTYLDISKQAVSQKIKKYGYKIVDGKVVKK